MATAGQRHLNVAGFMDNLLWGKQQDKTGNDVKYGVFPITRYRNILNRPRVITEEDNIALTANGDFHLVVTEIEDMDDDDVYALYKQNW